MWLRNQITKQGLFREDNPLLLCYLCVSMSIKMCGMTTDETHRSTFIDYSELNVEQRTGQGEHT